MHILLQALLGDLATDGKPVLDGVKLAGKAVPNGLPFETFLPRTDGPAAANGVPVRAGEPIPRPPRSILLPVDAGVADGIVPDTGAPPVEVDGLLTANSYAAEVGLEALPIASTPRAPEDEPESPAVPVPGVALRDMPIVQTRGPIADPGGPWALKPIVRQGPTSGQSPGVQQGDDASRAGGQAPVGPNLPENARTRMPRENPLETQAAELGIASETPPAPGPRNAPPQHVPFIGLVTRPETANTEVKTPSRSANRTPVTVPAARSVQITDPTEPASRPAPDLETDQEDDLPVRHVPEPAADAARHAQIAANATIAQEQFEAPQQTAPSRDTTANTSANPPAEERAAPDHHARGTQTAWSSSLADIPDRPVHDVRNPAPAFAPLDGPDRAEGGAPATEAARPRGEPARLRPVVGQVVQAIARSLPDGVVELRLQPEELGRLRLVITPAETGHTVLVTAERPETLDLVRRHIDLFSADLKERGFQNLDFSFGQEGEATGRRFEESPDVSPVEEAPPGDGMRVDIASRPVFTGGRVDLRI